jgi:hypothetical protein
MSPGERVAAASKLMGQACGALNLMLAQHRVSRATVRQAAHWARQAAEALEAVAGVDPPAGGVYPLAIQTGGVHGHDTKLPSKPAINLTAEKPPKLARAAVVGGTSMFKVPVGSFTPPGIGNVGPGKRK